IAPPDGPGLTSRVCQNLAMPAQVVAPAGGDQNTGRLLFYRKTQAKRGGTEANELGRVDLGRLVLPPTLLGPPHPLLPLPHPSSSSGTVRALLGASAPTR